MRCRKLLLLTPVFLFGLISSLHAEITFTGYADQDFKPQSCLADAGGLQDVGMPPAFGGSFISGFDIQKVCFSYDPVKDTLYVGIQTFRDQNNFLIFGDADGNGDPAGASTTLQSLGGVDVADLGANEFFTFLLDLNHDDAPDVVVGTHNKNDLSGFAAVAGVAAPNNELQKAPFESFYGAPLPGVTATLAHLPSKDKPHLEFSIHPFTALPGYGLLNFSDPDSFFQLYLATGSLNDDGIANESYPNNIEFARFKAEALLDTDGDTINDFFDPDDDNDGISDLEEKNLAVHDTDGNGFLSAAEAQTSGLDKDGDDDVDIKDVGKWPDKDKDGVPDYLDPVDDHHDVADGKPTPVDSLPATAAESSGAGETRLGGDVDLTQGPVRLQGAGGCSLLPEAGSVLSFLWTLIVLLWLTIVPRAYALRADHYTPSMDGKGFLSLESAQGLAPKEFSLGLSQQLTHANLGFGVTATGQKLDNIVNYFFISNLTGAFSYWEGFTIGINIPFSWISQVEDLDAVVERNTISMGDIRLLAKMELIKDWLALIPFVDLPSGEARDFYGEKTAVGGMKFAGSHQFGRHEVGANLGTVLRGTETISASNFELLTIGPEMLWGFGYRVSFIPSHDWYAMTQLWGKTDFASEATSPAEWDFGLQKEFPKSHLQTTLGGGMGLTKGYGTPTYRILFEVGFLPGKS